MKIQQCCTTKREESIEGGDRATHTFLGPATRWDWTDVYDFQRRLDWWINEGRHIPKVHRPMH